MTKVISMVKALRLKRAPVTAEVINSVAKGFIIANDRSLLIENGGYISLSHQCGCNLLYMMEQEGKEMCGWKSSTENYQSPLVYEKEPSYIFNDKLNKGKSEIKYRMT